MSRRRARSTFGARLADVTASFVGSFLFLGIYLGITLIWMVENELGPIHFDRYPFIAYTCSVSVLAILLSSLILLAQNRQATVDRTRDDREAQEVDAMFRHLTALVVHVELLLELNRNQMTMLEEQNAVAAKQHESIRVQLAAIIDILRPWMRV